MALKGLFLSYILFFSLSLFAQSEPPQFFTLDGRFTEPNTTDPLLDASIAVTIQVLNPAKTCILYEEQQTMSTLATSGYFNVRVGSAVGAIKRTAFDSANSMNTVFYNRTTPIIGKNSGGGACTYTPLSGDERYFRFFVTPSSTGQTAQLSPDMTLDSVPQAIVAQTLQGLTPSNVFQTSATSTQAKLDNLLTTNYSALTDLIAGTSTEYLHNNSDGTQLPSPTADPGTPVEGQVWYNSTTNQIKFFDGTTVQTLGVAGSGITSLTAGSGLDGGTITTTGTISISSGGVTNAMLATGIDASKITTGTLPAGVVPTGTDTTKLPLAGGTLTGALTLGAPTNFASFDLLNLGHLTISGQRTLRFGQFDNVQQTTLLTTPLTPGQAGTTWYNTDSGKLMYWNGTQSREVAETTTTVSSVFSRTGAVVAANGDYTASQITNTASGTIAATTAQTAIDELDSEKVAKAGDAMTGALTLNAQNEARFADSDSSNYVALRSPATVTANVVWTLPSADGSSGTTLTTNGAGVLTWSAPSFATSVNANTGTPVAPSISFTTEADTGLYNSNLNAIGVTNGGSQTFEFNTTGLQSPNTRGPLIATATGSATNATYSFNGDPDTGWYSPAADTLRATTAGSDRMTILPNGNVGIGTAAPSNALHVRTSDAVTNTTTNLLRLEHESTGTPAANFGTGLLFTGETTTTANQDMAQISSIWTTATHASRASALTFSTLTGGGALSEKMRINGDGSIGIGNGGANVKVAITGGLRIDNSDQSNGTTWENGLSFGGGSGEGITSRRAAGGNQYGLDLFTASTMRLSITSGGNVGIGTTGPNDKLQVVGDIRVGTSGTNGCLKDFGGGTITGTCSSDARLKRDFKSLESVSEKLSRLSPKYYHWRSEEFPNKHFGDQEELGLIAQDLLNVIPELVTIDEDGLYRVKYQQLPFYLIKGFSEQQQALKVVSRDIASVNAKTSKLEADVNERMKAKDQEIAKLKSRLERQEKDLIQQKKELSDIKKKLGL